MKNLNLVLVSVLFFSLVDLASAQSEGLTPTVTPITQNNLGLAPTVTPVVKNNISPTPTVTPIFKSNLQTVNRRLLEQLMQINADLASGYITQTQAAAIRQQIKVIHQQVLANMNANGVTTLTNTQAQQLKGMLDTNAASLSIVR